MKEKHECPMCKSKELNFMPWLGIIYDCRKCGWRGPLALHKDEKLDKFSKDTRKV